MATQARNRAFVWQHAAWRAARPYVAATLAVFAATLLRWIIWPLVGDSALFLTFLPAVMLVAWRFRALPALAALLLSCLVALTFFWPPYGFLHFSGEELYAAVGYLAVGLIAVLLTQVVRDFDVTADETHEQAQATEELLENTEELLDNSERLQMLLDSLSESESRYRLLSEALPQFVWTATSAGDLDYCNQHWLDYTGQKLSETLATPWTAIVHPDDLATTLASWQHARGGRAQFQVEFRIRRAYDGAYRWHLGRVSPIRNSAGQIAKWVGTAVDIDDQKRAQAALVQRQEHFRLLAEAIPQIVWTADHRGQVEYFNHRWFLYTGLTPDQSYADDGWARALHPDDRQRCLERWAESVRSGKEYQIEYRFRRGSDGAYRWHLGRGLPVIDPLDDHVRWFGTCTDIEDQKQAEADRQRLLESEREARSEAERASRVKDEFLATLSHELRTPLSAVLGYAQLLRRVENDPEVVRQGLETIERSAKAQAQLISDMLDVTRIMSGKTRLNVRSTALADALDAAIETVGPAADSKRIAIVREIDRSAPPLSGDPERLQQVFWNLLSNAVKFTPGGGTVRVRLERAGSNLEVAISDSGQGIPPDFLPYVFERFRQADGSSTRQHGGLGLGLSIVKHLVELHGGSVSAESEGAGRGATFKVVLPAAPTFHTDAPTRPRVEEDWEAPDLKGVKVLVVDDEPDSLRLVRHWLESFECAVTTAASVEEALRHFRESPPDVLVSDLGMPNEDGYSLIRKVRQLPPERGGKAPAVALTALARPEDRARALQAGFQVHVAKPIEAPALLSAIAHLARPADRSPKANGQQS